MSTAVRIESGTYCIGSDSIPGAGPQHNRRLANAYWIDVLPVSWAHFEVFVAGGGYACDELWPAQDAERLRKLRAESVDQRCRILLEQAQGAWSRFGASVGALRNTPVLGVTWFEATAIARFFGARLAHEEEWEVALSGSRKPASILVGSDWTRLPQSRWGCAVMIGTMEEWTISAFTLRYWRHEVDQKTPAWTSAASESDVCVRGAKPESQFQDVCARRGQDPNSGDRFLGFRRVWDRPPTRVEMDASWR